MILGAMISLSLAGEARKGSPLRSTKLRVIWGILLMVRQRARSESDVEFCRPLRRGCTAPGWGEGRQGGGQVDRELSWGPPGAGSQARGVRVSVLLVCSGDRGGVTEKQARPDSSPLEGHTPQPNPETTNRQEEEGPPFRSTSTGTGQRARWGHGPDASAALRPPWWPSPLRAILGGGRLQEPTQAREWKNVKG